MSHIAWNEARFLLGVNKLPQKWNDATKSQDFHEIWTCLITISLEVKINNILLNLWGAQLRR